MNDILKLILSLSLSGSILMIFLFAIKPLIKQKISKSIQYYLWFVVILRLLLPISFEGSLMNHIFNNTLISQRNQGIYNREIDNRGFEFPEESLRYEERGIDISNSFAWPNARENVEKGVYQYDADHSRYFEDLFNQYALNLWLIGSIIALTINLAGYIVFMMKLKKTNQPATIEQNRILIAISNSKCKVRLVRNSYVTTPMLIGIVRPYIIIPNLNYEEHILRNILLHELMHHRRFDIEMKWMTMLATSVHWFNPLMYLLKKEINKACELSCDEAVISNLSASEKQSYGETLLSVVAEHNYPTGVLQATMCEEKKTLKERLLSIMNYNKRSKVMIGLSVILFGVILICALYLGTGVVKTSNTPPKLYISTEEDIKVARVGTYEWHKSGRKIQMEEANLQKLFYEADNIIYSPRNHQREPHWSNTKQRPSWS